MNSLERLACLLAPAEAPEIEADPVAGARLDALIERLRKKVSQGSEAREPVDLQREAVVRFMETSRVESLRDARLLAFGLTLPVGVDGLRLIDDKGRLHILFTAIDAWLAQPRWFRRCYQGLVWSYFHAEPGAAGSNWLRLRDYLHRRANAIIDSKVNPDWVKAVVTHRSVFGDQPCEAFVGRLLCGDRSELEGLCEQVGIGESSWFLRSLVEAQVLAATQRGHQEFLALLPAMLAMLAGGQAWRDAGLSLLLERYSQVPQAPLDVGLRDALARHWGCPWKPVDALRWEGVGEAARKLAGDWLKAHALDVFFARMPDGARRAAFWKRYLPSIQSVEGALVVMAGCARLVLDADPVLAFDTRKPLHAAPELRLAYRDGVDGWRQWEQAFEAMLKDRFDLRVGAARAASDSAFVDLSDSLPVPQLADRAPLERVSSPRWHSASNGEDVHWQTAEAMSVPYSRPDLQVLARVHALVLEDEGGAAGRVRVRGAGIDRRIALVLARWGFAEVAVGEWYR